MYWHTNPFYITEQIICFQKQYVSSIINRVFSIYKGKFNLKVLILSACVGGGHERAARALESNIISEGQEDEVKVVNTLGYISAFLNKTINESYKIMVKSVPKMFEIIYKKSDKKSSFNSFIAFLNHFFSRKILPLLKEFDPEVIISTHMFPTEMVSFLKSQKKTFIPLICVITDYTPHKTWLSSHVDAYVVASKEMVQKMVDLGINEKKIFPFGIPVDNLFFEKQNRSEIIKELGLKERTNTVLIMAGSFGVKGILPIYTNLIKSKLDLQIILITGKNKTLYEKLSCFIEKEKYNNENVKNTRIIYFTDKVHKFMKISDLVITKPGGMTVSEALASNLPMAVFDAVPGQEEANANFLIKNNLGIKISQNYSCLNEVETLLKNTDRLKSLKESCREYSKFVSNKNIYNLVKSLAIKS